jgi:hypothetical protein
MVDYTDFSQQEQSQKPSRLAQSAPLLVFAFTSSMLVSALLLFFVQPMFTKMVLPLLGGSSGVWNTAMVFFQTVLLGGYLYAHLLTKYFRFKTQIMIHGLVMATSILFLPIAVPQEWAQPVAGTPIFWLIGLFTVVLGMPFFALSANAPLMQKWFSYTSHEKADDPYFLYAASNVGSLFSLLSYPVLIEPFFKVSEQSFAWAFVFVVLLIGLMACGVLAYHCRTQDNMADEDISQTKVNVASSSDKSIKLSDRVFWTLCALVPSGLMLAVTTHITSNIASAPLLWVLPLALYLLTFIFAFAPKPYITTRMLSLLFLPAAALMIVSAKLHLANWIGAGPEVILHLVGFFIITQYCHNRLAEHRPNASHLTEFYFFMSLGGVLGGATIALVAPLVFVNSYEYSLMIIVAAFVVAIREFKPVYNVKTGMIAAALLVGALFVVGYVPPIDGIIFSKVLLVYTALLMVLYVLCKPVYLKGAVYMTAVWALSAGLTVGKDTNIFAERSFFGISRVTTEQTDQGLVHVFIHGNTVHNRQLRGEANENYPLSYYAPQGSFGQAIDAVRADKGPLKVAAIGLGAGALACHVQKKEDWVFYEIDPLVEKMARDTSLFSFIDKCAPDVPVQIGDARLTLADEAKGTHDLVIVDAFSSDAIPAHLMTQEALQLYQSLLKEDGFVFFHTSNRNLDVTSVAIAVAQASGYDARAIHFKGDDTMKHHALVNDSAAVMVGKEASLERIFKVYPDWKKQDANPIVGVWTDDFTHILGAYLANYIPPSK